MPTPTRTRPWFGDRSGPPEIGLPQERIAELVAYELRDMPLPAHPIALQPFVVPLASYRELLSATAAVFDLIHRAALASGTDRPSRIQALNVDPADCPTWTDDEEWELEHCADMTRADVIVTEDGPKFIEFNVSGAFGGLVHFALFHRAWQRICDQAGRPAFVGVDAYARLATLIERTCAKIGVEPSIALVGTPREWGPNTPRRNFLLQADLLRHHGIRAEHLDFEELLDALDRHPLGLGQFTIQDADAFGYDISPVREAQRRGFRLIPSATCWLLHTKRLLALLSEGQPWMTDADHELAARYLPWSRLIGDRKVRWRDVDYDLPTLLRERQESFVIKGATGCSGDEVVFGARTTPAEWVGLIEQALPMNYYIAQEVVRPPVLPVDVLHESGEITRVEANTVISPFVIGGTPAGCFARFIDTHQPGIVSALSQARLSCLLGET
ncbi:MAG: hypothetical protein ACM30G_19490 [Micromonosporaceae bacterium]